MSVQSPNVGGAVRKYLDVANPPKFGMLPAVLPVIGVPFEELRYAYVSISVTIDAVKVMFTVPEDEDWMVHHLSIWHVSGDGHIDDVSLYPAWDTIAANVHDVADVNRLYVVGEITTFPYMLNFPSGLPMGCGSELRLTGDFNSVTDVFRCMVAFKRRKW